MDMTEQRPLLDTLAEMTAASIARVDLDDRELMLVRLAGLVAVDAPPASYLLNLGPGCRQRLEAGRRPERAGRAGPDRGWPPGRRRCRHIATALGYALAIEDALDDEEA